MQRALAVLTRRESGQGASNPPKVTAARDQSPPVRRKRTARSPFGVLRPPEAGIGGRGSSRAPLALPPAYEKRSRRGELRVLCCMGGMVATSGAAQWQPGGRDARRAATTGLTADA